MASLLVRRALRSAAGAIVRPVPARRGIAAMPTEDISDFALASDATDTPDAPEFRVGVRNGFLPRHDPLPTLPGQFETLVALLNEMPVTLPSGQCVGRARTQGAPSPRIRPLSHRHRRAVAACGVAGRACWGAAPSARMCIADWAWSTSGRSRTVA